MKKLFSIALALCLLLSVALADVTLTKVYKTEDLVSNTFHNGFVTAIGMTGENTVVLKDDGTYEYTKRLMQTAEDGTVTADIVYTFTGTYTKDGDTVVLMFPTAGTASENCGGLLLPEHGKRFLRGQRLRGGRCAVQGSGKPSDRRPV